MNGYDYCFYLSRSTFVVVALSLKVLVSKVFLQLLMGNCLPEIDLRNAQFFGIRFLSFVMIASASKRLNFALKVFIIPSARKSGFTENIRI